MSERNMRIEFFVPGIPRPAGSKNAFLHSKTQKIIVTDSSGKKGKAWRDKVSLYAQEAYKGTPLSGPIRLVVVFRLPRPKVHYGTGRNANVLKRSSPVYPKTRPDTTKLLRAVEDSLTHIIWSDDSQVVQQEASKTYAMNGRVGANVTVEAIEPEVSK